MYRPRADAVPSGSSVKTAVKVLAELQSQKSTFEISFLRSISELYLRARERERVHSVVGSVLVSDSTQGEFWR